MPNQKPTNSIALRIATLMERERIESLPRNYELVYDAYSGVNPELARDFASLGPFKSQRALDEIGRKYLPHQHEESVLAKANEAMRSQMADFHRLIQDEMSSLTEFGKAIDEANRALGSENGPDHEALARSIVRLSKATEQQVRSNQTLSDAAAAQNTAMAELKQEMEALEARKWEDPSTGLANRRSFNKAVLGIYANPSAPRPSGLIFAEIDDFRSHVSGGDNRFAGDMLRSIANSFSAAIRPGQLVSYLDKGRFAVLLNTESPDHLMRFIESLRAATNSARLSVTGRTPKISKTTLSYGVALATNAANAGELIENGEGALQESLGSGGNAVTFHTADLGASDRKPYRIYAAG